MRLKLKHRKLWASPPPSPTASTMSVPQKPKQLPQAPPPLQQPSRASSTRTASVVLPPSPTSPIDASYHEASVKQLGLAMVDTPARGGLTPPSTPPPTIHGETEVLVPDMFTSILSIEPTQSPHYAQVKREADAWIAE